MARPYLLAPALCLAVTTVAAAPAGPQVDEPAPVVTATRSPLPWQSWSWSPIWAGWADVTVGANRMFRQLPGFADSFAAAIQVEWRDAARHSEELMARLMPTEPAPPDLRPLVASPVPNIESSGFGWRSDPINHRNKFHKGTDFHAKRGTPVYAAGAGVVAFCGQQHGYGNVIYVDHGGGLVTRYAHLSKIEVRKGTAVAAATLIGLVGATGRTTGPHLHFEVRIEGRAVDPVLAMHVAELERNDPSTAWLVAQALAPEVQDATVDRNDPPSKAIRARTGPGHRPERRGAPLRDRALW